MSKDVARSPNDHRRKETEIKKSNAEKCPTGTLSETEHYLKEKKVFETFHYLLSHLIIDKPENPIEYLYELIDDCILFRSGFKHPRLFWMKRHLEAIFENLRTGTSDVVSLNRYKLATKALGTPYYDACFSKRAPGYVDRDTFCAEALGSLEKELMCITSTSIRRGSPICDCDAKKQFKEMEEN